jgi:hypothetical protein
MTIVGIRGPSASDWAYAASVMKRCLEEFLATPDARRPKDLNTRLIGSFRDLFELAIFYAQPHAKPSGKNVPKQVRINDPSWGVGVLQIATTVLSRAGVAVETFDEYEPLLRRYYRFIRRLPETPRLKGKDRELAMEVQKFIVALNAEAANASLERHDEQADDD